MYIMLSHGNFAKAVITSVILLMLYIYFYAVFRVMRCTLVIAVLIVVINCHDCSHPLLIISLFILSFVDYQFSMVA